MQTRAAEQLQTKQDNKRPNILLIVADDLGYSDIGSFGGDIATPTLDNLAKQGLQFTNFHVLPTCSPTRSVLMSGMDNHQAGMGTMGEVKTTEMEGHPGYAGYLNFEVAALPEVLKAGGYHTYMSGKWHLGHEEKTSPHARGFEETFVLTPGGGSHWNDQKPLSPPQTMIYRRNGKVVNTLPDGFYSTKYYTDILLQWLEQDRNDDKPFFAYLSYTAPHDPLHAPKEYIEKYKGKYDEGWDVLREKRLQGLKDLGIVHKDAKSFPRLASVKAWNKMSSEERAKASRDMEVYAAMIDYMDEQIKENRGLKNSFIETGPGWAQASMAPGRLFKGFTSEGGIKSPMLVKTSGKMANAGSMNHSFFHVRDIMPTFLELASVAHSEQFSGRKVRPMQGKSVLELLEGKATKPYAGANHVGYEIFGLKAYFVGDWKILWMPKPFGPGKWELFNLKQDLAELNDLSKQHPNKLKEMVALWEQYKKENKVLDISMDMSVFE
jgi:arylsulfatase